MGVRVRARLCAYECLHHLWLLRAVEIDVHLALHIMHHRNV
jgi:hypothetical protein